MKKTYNKPTVRSCQIEEEELLAGSPIPGREGSSDFDPNLHNEKDGDGEEKPYTGDPW